MADLIKYEMWSLVKVGSWLALKHGMESSAILPVELCLKQNPEHTGHLSCILLWNMQPPAVVKVKKVK